MSVTGQEKHSSVFDLNWLHKQSYDTYIKKMRQKQILWDKNTAAVNVAQVDAELYIDNDICLREFLISLAVFGVAFVKNVSSQIVIFKISLNICDQNFLFTEIYYGI